MTKWPELAHKGRSNGIVIDHRIAPLDATL